MGKSYAGIGSRATPPRFLALMTKIAGRLSVYGFTLRSGGAAGADNAFEQGAGAKEVYLPWRRFNGNDSPLWEQDGDQRAMDMAATLHPAWATLSPAVRKLMARNCRQILGATLDDPVSFVVCYTPDGCESEEARSRKTGGTGQAITLAGRHGIPVINLANENAIARIAAIVKPSQEVASRV